MADSPLPILPESAHSREQPLVLTLSGSDPGGGAGLEADLKTFQRHGVFGMAVPTLLTVQNTTGVRKVKTLEPDFFEEQVAFLLEDLFPSVIKIGAIGDRRMLQALIRILSQKRMDAVKVVVDTVLNSTSGAGLFDMRGLADFIDRLLPRAYVITPNVLEFDLLTGKPTTQANAAAHLLAFGRDKPYAILLKGGHFPGDPIDFLYHRQMVRNFPSQRIDTPHTHGTGCTLASAIAANLALGLELADAVVRARAYVREAIRSNPGLGSGRGPLNFNAAV
ncbi:MAG TPA: bifunctional hydroxymethylpyrimidine kinase/phosphomethylpyrimidine kinase [Fibrobacteria bacterium]|nr:bifunctional hydroxymethylpyrimidine kinase/phosphomethylpyrimidine kinase [Fibrobacteria bacterium]